MYSDLMFDVYTMSCVRLCLGLLYLKPHVCYVDVLQWVKEMSYPRLQYSKLLGVFSNILILVE